MTTTPPPGADGQTEKARRIGKCVAVGSDQIIIATAVTVDWADKIVAALAAGAPVQSQPPTAAAISYWEGPTKADGSPYDTPERTSPHGWSEFKPTTLAHGKAVEERRDSDKRVKYLYDAPSATPLQVSGATSEVPKGYMLVPIKITPEMIERGIEEHYGKRRVAAVGGALSAAPAGAVVARPDLSMLGVPLPHEVRGILEKYPSTKFVLLADVEALFAAPTPTTGDTK